MVVFSGWFIMCCMMMMNSVVNVVMSMVLIIRKWLWVVCMVVSSLLLSVMLLMSYCYCGIVVNDMNFVFGLLLCVVGLVDVYVSWFLLVVSICV